MGNGKYFTQAAGGSSEADSLGRSRGGSSAKTYAITDAQGYLLDFILIAGEAGGTGQAENLLALTSEGVSALLADKRHDGDDFVQAVRERN
ncbi:hypothetical protein [Methylomicrobium sp. Wu6]|uniref:hypothetical protein n=1 Tax=Methylomicrobium sp. Wu6 TaxID=3107928 RepID=UPI002DD6B00F|nr:hypothetical protein [Methylomicrobium sp. Wu6]MEC4748481.1 hypothetical protein [Methylomicrobium sp. Wu6]